VPRTRNDSTGPATPANSIQDASPNTVADALLTTMVFRAKPDHPEVNALDWPMTFRKPSGPALVCSPFSYRSLFETGMADAAMPHWKHVQDDLPLLLNARQQMVFRRQREVSMRVQVRTARGKLARRVRRNASVASGVHVFWCSCVIIVI
jgi:hypothetical protein